MKELKEKDPPPALEKIQCPSCQGRKVFFGPYYMPGTSEDKFPCWTCNARGYVFREAKEEEKR